MSERAKMTASLAAITANIRKVKHPLTARQARHLLSIRFNKADDERVTQLLEKNRESHLTASEARELDEYVAMGDELGVLQSQARKLLGIPLQPLRHG